jgi:hypothetical protein
MSSGVALSAEIGAAAAAVAASSAVLAALLEGVGAGGDSAGLGGLRGVDPLREVADACLDGLAEVARCESRLAALKALLTAGYVRSSQALARPAANLRDAAVQEMSTVAEIACVLTVSERAAGALICDALALTEVLPLTLAALGAGGLSWQHARVMVDEAANLDEAGAAALEAHFLDPDAPAPARGCPAGELVAGRFRAKARTWRERHHPVSIETRHTGSACDRRVEFVPDRDGMAWLRAYLPADTAAGIWERTTTAARALQGPAEIRTLTQLRADIAATLLLTNNLPATATNTSRQGTRDDASGDATGVGLSGGVPVPRAQVLVTVPVLSLLGVSEEPAMLDGYGPIPPSMARRLAAEGAGSFYRVLTDPRDGAPLEIGRTSYRLPTAMRQWLRLRDGKCPFPGCNNPSLDNDADHLLAWADGGTTGISNLGQPCHKHHYLKHTTAWTPTPATTTGPPGWTSPTGRHYASEQQDWEPPHRPNGLPFTETNPLPGTTSTRADPDHPHPRDPGGNPDPDLPPDPFPDWYHFTALDEPTDQDPDDHTRPDTPPDPCPDRDLVDLVTAA